MSAKAIRISHWHQGNSSQRCPMYIPQSTRFINITDQGYIAVQFTFTNLWIKVTKERRVNDHTFLTILDVLSFLKEQGPHLPKLLEYWHCEKQHKRYPSYILNTSINEFYQIYRSRNDISKIQNIRIIYNKILVPCQPSEYLLRKVFWSLDPRMGKQVSQKRFQCRFANNTVRGILALLEPWTQENKYFNKRVYACVCTCVSMYVYR